MKENKTIVFEESRPICLTIMGEHEESPDFGMISLSANYENAKYALPPVEREQVRINVFAICSLFDIDEDTWWEIVDAQTQGSLIKENERLKMNSSGYTKFFLVDVINAFRHHYMNCLEAIPQVVVARTEAATKDLVTV